MNLKIKNIFLIFLLLSMTSCSSNKSLKIENDTLKKKVTTYQGKVANLELQLKDSQLKNEELMVLSSNLNKEKASRAKESNNLRSEIRQFIRREMDDFRTFFKDSDIADYIGGELIDRSTTSGSNLTLIDFAHTFPQKGRLLGATVRISQPSVFSVLVLRRVENKLVVLWKSEQFRATTIGNNKVAFKLDVTVEQGDILGFYFPETVGVSYNKNTGDTGIIRGELQAGKMIEISSVNRKEKRSYSAGIYGFFVE